MTSVFEHLDIGRFVVSMFCVVAVCLLVALVVFVAVMPCYQVAQPEGSVLGNIARIFWEALTAQFKHWRYPQPVSSIR